MEIKTTDNERLRFNRFQITRLMVNRAPSNVTKTSVYFEGHRYADADDGSKVFEDEKRTGSIDDLELFVEQKLIASGAFADETSAKEERRRLRRLVKDSEISQVESFIAITVGLIADELGIVEFDGLADI